MKILLTGVTGYIGKRALIQLLTEGHEVICVVRDKNRFQPEEFDPGGKKISVIEADFLEAASLHNLPRDIDAAFYFLHSMADRNKNFEEAEAITAGNFKTAVEKTNARQVIYLTGIVNEAKLSRHLQSRKDVEEILKSDAYALTVLRAGIIVGSGSASFEIIRDLVEKLPFMIAPKWIETQCQPIAIRNVLEFLMGVLGKEKYFNATFDIAGPEILTYKQMLLAYASVRQLRRRIITVPVFTPRLSSYWLYFITSTSYSLAKNLVDSMAIPVLAKKNELANELGIALLGYKEAVKLAFDKIEQNDVMSSWYDSFSDRFHKKNMWQFMEVPAKGCFVDKKQRTVEDQEKTLEKIFGIGGQSGWYAAGFLWKIRGLLDKLFGGVGLKRGRRNRSRVLPGDSVDFWRVLVADKKEQRLLLFAEMKLPGEAWLEFKIADNILYQTASFRPKGIAGRLYWYAVYPFHFFIFNAMITKLAGK
ncbi:MAG: SDR family oxidoreductase [Sphingobacteriales bacterium]|nr:MAG: SDR family oxidoreductase [Sphingobacteriales bacterium]